MPTIRSKKVDFTTAGYDGKQGCSKLLLASPDFWLNIVSFIFLCTEQVVRQGMTVVLSSMYRTISHRQMQND